jgi:hypothetical protein
LASKGLEILKVKLSFCPKTSGFLDCERSRSRGTVRSEGKQLKTVLNDGPGIHTTESGVLKRAGLLKCPEEL